MSFVSGLELKNCNLRVENTQAVVNTHLIKLSQFITPMDAYQYAKMHLHASKKGSSKKNSAKKNKWQATVLGFGSKQPLQQQSTLAYFTGPVCMVVL